MPADPPPRVRPRTNAPDRALERADYIAPNGDTFDEIAASRATSFFPRYLRLTKDRWAGAPFRLAEWQADDIIRSLFGWKRADGTRRFRRLIWFVPRKNGKTETAAGLAIMATTSSPRGAETYLLASTEAQARICFDKCVAMVNMNEALSRDCATTTQSIYWPEHDSFIKPLDGRARGKHGLNASALVADELHEWRNADLYTTVHQSMAAREQPIEVLVSTAGLRDFGYGWQVWQEALRILDGTSDDDETLVVIYAADADDDWTLESTWRKANPNLGVSVTLDYLKSECRKAQGNPRLENDFRRYHLNQWTNQSVRWLPLAKWDASGASHWRDESALVGKSCVGGVDLSSNNDLTCVAWAFDPDASGVSRRVYRVFMPQGRIAERVASSGIPYDRWVDSGAIVATPGDTVDYEFVIHQIMRDCETFDVRLMGFDRWNMTHVTNRCQALGLPAEKMVAVGQGFATMSGAAKFYEKRVYDGTLDHAGHPVARWCADNVTVIQDPAGNIKPAKNKSAGKIDVVVADIIAEFVAINGGAPEGFGVMI